jgi:prephenate dehydrogenase
VNIAVVGLGIIGGSFCKAIKKYTDHRVIGINRTQSTAEKALKEGAIDEIGTHESLENADLIILSMYPQAVVDYVSRYGENIKKGAVVTDVSGIKRAICPQMTKLSEKFGFVFAGSHPMAGKETNGRRPLQKRKLHYRSVQG